MGGGSPSNQTVTSKSDPWEKIQPYLLDIAGRAQNTYNQNPSSAFPGATTAPKSSQPAAGQQSLYNSGAAAQGNLNQAGSTFNSIANSSASSPYLTQIGQIAGQGADLHRWRLT